jgi:hypothetical protein
MRWNYRAISRNYRARRSRLLAHCPPGSPRSCRHRSIRYSHFGDGAHERVNALIRDGNIGPDFDSTAEYPVELIGPPCPYCWTKPITSVAVRPRAPAAVTAGTRLSQSRRREPSDARPAGAISKG